MGDISSLPKSLSVIIQFCVKIDTIAEHQDKLQVKHLVYDGSPHSSTYQFLPKSGHMSPTPKIDTYKK
jgi:hypothetical protein